jgi:S-adenosylmethionine:tRNA ribosyltransferase-isomerase
MEHRRFVDLQDYLTPEDVVVLNNTRVIPARLTGKKEATGGKVDLLLLRGHGRDEWEVLVEGKVRKGTRIVFDEDCSGVVLEDLGFIKRFRMDYRGEWPDVLDRIGRIPLPPYIQRDDTPEDRIRYQTVFASRDGAVAAPTAGLHFTEEILQNLTTRGVSLVYVTLHVGGGTFRPVREEVIERHVLDPEVFEVGPSAADAVCRARDIGGRVFAVGTTAVRALETAGADGRVTPMGGETALFAYPGYRFRVVDALVTNFHLPKTTLLMLVAAFAGKELVMEAYREAMAMKYRFYSYGDAMLVL